MWQHMFESLTNSCDSVVMDGVWCVYKESVHALNAFSFSLGSLGYLIHEICKLTQELLLRIFWSLDLFKILICYILYIFL